jgi:hypothetical protein
MPKSECRIFNLMDVATKPHFEDDLAATERVLQLLAQQQIWVAPVGWSNLRGWMVCQRVLNAVDGGIKTRVDYLRVDPTKRYRWKKPFREHEHMFPTLELALRRAMEVTQA